MLWWLRMGKNNEGSKGIIWNYLLSVLMKIRNVVGVWN